MQKIILWSGIEYYSLEHCTIVSDRDGANVQSTIVGYYQQKIYKVLYQLRIDPQWFLLKADISCQHDDHQQNLKLEHDAAGNWLMNGREAKELAGCFDIDILLTPFTNTLPIRRLNMSEGDSREISVVYCDLLGKSIQPVKQQYTCVSPVKYHYTNVPNDFEANIELDHDSFVTDYPMLFTRTAVEIS